MRQDLAQRTLGVLVIAGLIGTSLWILKPFLPAIIWAATLVIATWPIMRTLQDKLWGRRAFAVAIMTIFLLAFRAGYSEQLVLLPRHFAGRVRMARIRQAALFISIHADALRKGEGEAQGATVYTLSETATDSTEPR